MISWRVVRPPAVSMGDRENLGQVSKVNTIINNDQVQSTASALFRSVAPDQACGILRAEDLDELGQKVDNFIGLTGSKIHFKANAAGPQGLMLERFEQIFWELIKKQQEVSVQAVPRSVADACIDGLPTEKYDVHGKLGKGTYGLVYSATDKNSRERRAIKSIEKARCGDDMESMKIEIQTLIQLDHPHILKLQEVYNSPDYLYLVTDVCSGGELYARIQQTQQDGGSIPENWSVHVMHQLLLAISHIHARGIIHLDLKSRNIMLMPSLRTKQHFDRPCEDDNYNFSFSETPHIVVIDLGVAKIFEPGNFKAGQPIGSPATMAPEVWHGVMTPEADVFSSGCVFFELLSFEMPWSWRFESFPQAIDFWSKQPRAAWEKVRLANPDAQMLLRKMLEQDRKNRLSAADCLTAPLLKLALQKTHSKSQADQHARAQLLRRLTTVHLRDGLYKNIALKIAKDWPPNQMPSFKRVFTELDVLNTGVLSEQELAESLANLGEVDAAVAKLSAAAMNMSRNKAAVDWTEFVAACIDLGKTNFQPAIWSIFKAADKDGDGLLSAKDIEGMLPEVHAYSKEAAKNIFINLTGRWSEDGGARVDWNTFVMHLWTQASAGMPNNFGNQYHVAQRTEQDRKAELQSKFGFFADVMDAIGSTGPQAQQFVDLLAGSVNGTCETARNTTSNRVTYPHEALPESVPDILRRLEEMGFTNTELNKKIVKANGGKLTDAAIASIISQSGNAPSVQASAGSGSQQVAFRPSSRVPSSGLPDLPPVPLA
eukprot:TRINITY_DN16440_c0_g1_i2.p1 TRINITY_DN16440_c0_g1~~TRINITY_DN16440_c0_g1_i2.p1  ORF type:complete len:770 (-),score=142.67 TRINITY_DN16440_c0_g1_i2:29-2338(-)